ncbi:MAG TPA: RNA polymerase-binding protein DksA [Aquabacterium sp.]|nr:RNA polymerase-binding protein DksA [Aquabacterium sp.]
MSKTSAKSPDTDKPASGTAGKKAATPVAAPVPAAKTAKTAPAKTTPAKAPSGKGDDKVADAIVEAAHPAERSPAVTAAAPTPGNNRFSDRFSPPKPPARGFPEPMETVKPAVKADPKLVNAWKSKAGRDLTEAELLAMPESEYMNDKQLDFFRARLQALKDDLLSNAGETTEHLREDTSIVPDPADRATIEEEHALELRTRDRERKLLKKISQSLGRIEAGDYGYCDETGEPIGLGRLLARPTATLSLEAQQRRELKQKMFGD